MLNPCVLCSAECCRDYLVTVTSFDVKRIMEKTGMGFVEFAALEPLRLLNFDNDLVLECYEGRGRKRLMYEYVLALKSHPCIFLRGNRCGIHGFAPLVCKAYPLNAGGRMAKGARCPPISWALFRLGGGVPGEYRRQLSEYKRIVAEWNRRKGGRGECVRFLLSRAGD